MLGVSLKKIKTNSVQPYSNQQQLRKKSDESMSPSSNQVASFLQKKMTSMQAKKLIKQFQSLDLKLKRRSSFSTTTSTILFESDEFLAKPTVKAITPPPKKSQTIPNISSHQEKNDSEKNHDELMNRTLPSLPSKSSITSSFGNKIKAKTNITKASTWVGKSLRSLMKNNISQQTMIENDCHSIFNQGVENYYEYSRTPTIVESSRKKILHCKILQITNLSSSKAYPYTLNVRVNSEDSQSYSGVMKRVARGVSTSNPHTTLSFPIGGKFTLDCNLSIQAMNSLGIVDRLKQMRRSNTLDCNNTSRLSQSGDNTIDGHLQLDSGDDILSSFANKGIGRYVIQTSHLHNPSLALELTLSFWLEDDRDESDESESHIERETLMFCQDGDYLTFYIKGESYPKWIRYWVTYEKNQLVLRLNELRGEPVEAIPIENLTGVNICPSDDIYEEIYLGKKHGIILSIGQNSVIYLFADSSKSLSNWQALLEALSSETNNDNEQKINKRYLWNTPN